MKSFLLMFLFCCSCSEQPQLKAKVNWQEIAGRDKNPQPIYRVKIPVSWQKKELPLNEPLLDTTKPIAEFFIKENEKQVRITIHNFPTNSIEERVPPHFQIDRWNKQFESIDEGSSLVKPIAYAGFSGLYFEATGLLNGDSVTMIGWSMQLSPEHYRNLFSTQIRADYTIKALGPVELVLKHKTSLISFAQSFELIEEIPKRS